MRQENEDGTIPTRANAAPDQLQSRASDNNARGRYARNDQTDRERFLIHNQSRIDSQAVAQPSMSTSSGERDWSARIRASIARLVEIDGICLNSDAYSKVSAKKDVAGSQQAFHARVDRLQAASETAHKEYYNRLRDVYSASTRKKMRLTVSAASPDPPASTSRHEALDTLAVAAATEQLNMPQMLEKTIAKHTKRSSRRQNSPPERHQGVKQTPVAVHDPSLTKAMDKLTGKLSELLNQLHATPDSVAAEPILAAAASIALEATEMRRCEVRAMTRMAEIEEHRQQILQGLLEYSKRKEGRERDDKRSGESASASDSRDSSPPAQDSAKIDREWQP